MSDTPYYVDVDEVGCEKCKHGMYFTIVFRPTETAEGISYGDEDEAQELADRLNDAYSKGADLYEALQAKCERYERALINITTGFNIADPADIALAALKGE